MQAAIEFNDHDFKLNDINSFEHVYTTYFTGLHRYVNSIINDEMESEEIVQNVFIKLWERKDTLDIQLSLKAYLYKSVYNESLNWLKHQKVKQAYESHSLYVMKQKSAPEAHEELASKTLQQKIREALLDLPEQCRTIFQLSRFEELKYREIAHQLNLSEKTVENQMGKALRILRLKLGDYLPTFIILITQLQFMLS
jgi:RNA polymerase sigma-70 factor (ECF subfamily)